MKAKFKKGDLVRVNDGRPAKPEYWKGKVVSVSISGTIIYQVKDMNPHGLYYGEVFSRSQLFLSTWNPQDDVNV